MSPHPQPLLQFRLFTKKAENVLLPLLDGSQDRKGLGGLWSNLLELGTLRSRDRA